MQLNKPNNEYLGLIKPVFYIAKYQTRFINSVNMTEPLIYLYIYIYYIRVTLNSKIQCNFRHFDTKEYKILKINKLGRVDFVSTRVVFLYSCRF